MPKSHQPHEVWQRTRLRVLQRDGYRCVRCGAPVTAQTAHVDHIVSGKRGTNALPGLRTLDFRCHALRLDQRHRGLVAEALRRGLIPADYRHLMWDDDDLP